MCAAHPRFFVVSIRRCFPIGKLDHELNEEIRDKEVRVIGADGAQLGIMSAAAALDLAAEQELDLVKIAPNSTPPVCKIMDYGKFRFETLKKEKEAKKNQRVVEIKEVRMSPNIDTNDFNTKVKSALKFLKDGDRVKVTVRFRGREMAHTSIGHELLVNFGEQCKELANVDKAPKLDGRHMSMFLSPKTNKK
ncbi:MAG: translation initiation factor IF-3 [Oscillospiraceae bacterium]|nr:translation initiation factor IF-3 [Oscillospiraceae bacterium]